MHPLVVATTRTAPTMADEVASGLHQRIDYIELAHQLGTTYLDYNVLSSNRAARAFEDRLRMDVRLAAHVVRAVRRQGYDTVICLSERIALPLSRLINRQVTLIVIVHHALSRRKLMSIRLSGARPRWTRMAALSTAEATALRVALNLPDEQVHALHTPVDTRFFDPELVPVAPPNLGNFIQSLGSSHRDYLTLLQAMQALPHIPCQLRVGSPWVIRDAGVDPTDLPPNVSLQPYLHPGELRASYGASRFIVVPIRGDTQWSAGCTSVQQAQAMGKAVVATAMPGLSEYVEDGVTGLLVGVGDERGMANAIDYLWRNPRVAERMGAAGRQRMLRHHTLDHWIQALRTISESASQAGDRT